jgi:hypothetical protein
MRQRLSGLELARLWPGVWRAALASAAMGAALLIWLRVSQTWPLWIIGSVGVAGGGILFWVAAYGLGSEEARALPQWVVNRLRRNASV